MNIFDNQTRNKQIDEYANKSDEIVFEMWGLVHASSWKTDYHIHKCDGQDGNDISFTKKSFECLCQDLTERGKLIERNRLTKQELSNWNMIKSNIEGSHINSELKEHLLGIIDYSIGRLK